MTDMLIASLHMSVPAWMDEEIARPAAEDGLHRQIEKAGGLVIGGVQWEAEEHVIGDEVYVVMHGRLYGYKRSQEEE